jgi:glycyl-tRNA synthetase beta chain
VALQPVPGAAVAAELYDYALERLRAYFLEAAPESGAGAVTTEMFDAVLATRPRSPLDFAARLGALAGFLTLPEAASLTAANRRIANILRKSAAGGALAALDPSLLREPAEVRLAAALAARSDTIRQAIGARDYAGALGELARLRPEVDAFFDGVMVMDPDAALRANRLALLGELRDRFTGIADLSRLPG